MSARLSLPHGSHDPQRLDAVCQGFPSRFEQIKVLQTERPR